MKVKLCGIKRHEDIIYMNEYKPDYVGFVFAGKKRRVTPEKAASLAKELSPRIKKVGVFVNEAPDNIERISKAVGLDAVQLHGDENEKYIANIRKILPDTEIWKAVRVKDRNSIKDALLLSADMLLFDSFSVKEYGGSGKTANLDLIKDVGVKRPYFIAGGLNAENIARIINKINPYGVDISSGIETDGVKDRRKIDRVMEIIHTF